MTDKRLPDLAKSIKRELVPNHVAIIMDGNGRWAQTRGRPRVYGHRCGADSVRATVECADQLGIKVLSLYAFSEENWGRPSHEVLAIMTLLNTYLLKERDELKANNVQFRTMGRIERLPERTQRLVRETQEYLAESNGLVLNIALSYGGRSEIVDACRSVAKRVQTGELALQDINSDTVASALYNCDLPPPDLLIRTSGEQRLSNFMLWQMAYTEFYFTDTHWPDFRKEQFVRAVYEYARRQRRFGLVQDDAEAGLALTSDGNDAGSLPLERRE